MIAFTLHRTVVRHKTDVEDLEAMFHLYVWGTDLLAPMFRLRDFKWLAETYLARNCGYVSSHICLHYGFR